MSTFVGCQLTDMFKINLIQIYLTFYRTFWTGNVVTCFLKISNTDMVHLSFFRTLLLNTIVYIECKKCNLNLNEVRCLFTENFPKELSSMIFIAREKNVKLTQKATDVKMSMNVVKISKVLVTLNGRSFNYMANFILTHLSNININVINSTFVSISQPVRIILGDKEFLCCCYILSINVTVS